MSEQRLSELQKWIVTNCYTGKIHDGIFSDKYKKELREIYAMKRVQIFKFFGFELNWNHYNLEVCKKYNGSMSFWFWLRNHNYLEILEKKPEKEKEYLELFGRLKQEGQNKFNSVSVTITRTIENLVSKGYIDVQQTEDFFGNRWYLDGRKKHFEELKDKVKTTKKTDKIEHTDFDKFAHYKLHMPLPTIEEYENEIKAGDQFFKKPFIGRGFGYNCHVRRIKLTEKGIEKAKELLGGDGNNI